MIQDPSEPLLHPGLLGLPGRGIPGTGQQGLPFSSGYLLAVSLFMRFLVSPLGPKGRFGLLPEFLGSISSKVSCKYFWVSFEKILVFFVSLHTFGVSILRFLR